MARRYRPASRDQPCLFPPSMRDWRPDDHLVWLVITTVDDHMDTSAFHAARRTGGAGPAGYDPDMLVTVLVWAYAHRVTSWREIERLCRTGVAFRVICGGSLPDHCTIARFRGDFPDAVAAFFAEVLALSARLGMGRLGVVALDGMKIAANAAKAANRTGETLAKMAAGTVARHGETDAAEDDLFGGKARGDEVPRGRLVAAAARRADRRGAGQLAGRAGRRRGGAGGQGGRVPGGCGGRDAACGEPAGRGSGGTGPDDRGAGTGRAAGQG
jgi:transposase